MNFTPFKCNLLNISESSFDCGLNNGSWPPIDSKSFLVIAQGANTPSVVSCGGLYLLYQSNNSCSFSSSGSKPKSSIIFSVPPGCNGGSTLVNDTTTPSFKNLSISSTAFGIKYISE